MVRHIVFLVFVIFIAGNTAFAQDFKSEEEKINYAAQLFDSQKYEEAKKLYSTIRSKQPKNPEYNYRFGACLVFGDEDEKKEAFKYLKYAAKFTDVDTKVYFYLAKAYHLNYQFKKAIQYYKEYKDKGVPKEVKKLQVDNEIRMCESGLKLMNKVSGLAVLKKD